MLARWRDICDQRLAVRARESPLLAAAAGGAPDRVAALDELLAALDGMLDDFPAYRQADVRLHVGLAELTGSPRLVKATTEIQGAMTDLISHIAHPPEVLSPPTSSISGCWRRSGATIRPPPRA